MSVSDPSKACIVACPYGIDVPIGKVVENASRFRQAMRLLCRTLVQAKHVWRIPLHSIDNVIESCSFQCRLLHYGLFIPTFVGTLAVRISLAWPHEVPGFRAKMAGKRRAETYVMLDLPQLRMQQYLKHNMRRRRSLIPSGRWP